MEQSFEESVSSWLQKCQKMVNEYYSEQFSSLQPPIVKLDGGRKFLRVITESTDAQSGRISTMAFAFIATVDGNTKSMGSYQKGDIFKPATWKAPAKHARGNLFDDSNGMSCMTPFGPKYL